MLADRKSHLLRLPGTGLLSLALVILLANPLTAAKETVVFNSFYSDPGSRPIVERMVRLFEQQNPDYDVVLNVFPHEEFKVLLRTWLAAPQGPDVVTWFSGERMFYFVRRGLVAPINEAFEPGGFSAFFPSSLLSLVSRDGQIYMVPTEHFYTGFWYRKSMFAGHGLNAPRNWEEFLAASRKLKGAGVTPIAIGTKDQWPAASWFTYLTLRVQGYDFYSALMEGRAAYTDPRLRQVFTDYWKPLIEEEFYLKDHPAYSWQEAVPFLVSGRAAMYLMGSWITDTPIPAEVQKDLGFFQFPVIKPGVPIVEEMPMNGLMMPANARNKRGALAFLRFMAGKEAQSLWLRGTAALAANKDVPVPPELTDIYQMVARAVYATQWYDRDTNPEMATLGMQLMVEFMLNPGQVDVILQRFERERQRVFGVR